MTWFDVAMAALVAILTLGLVGGILGLALRLRGLWLWAAAAPLGVTVIGAAAIIAPWVGLRWSLLPVVIVALLLAGGAWLLARLPIWHWGGGVRRRVDLWLIVGLGVAAVLLVVRIVQILGSPEAISQTFDNIFHLNAVRYVLDTGNASSLSVGSLTSPGGSLFFYPAAWHGLVSLIVQLSGVTIPAAVNAATLVVGALVWPLGVVLLTRTLFGRNRVVTVASALFAASVPVFPILLMDYGVLYPLHLGYALLPAALAATIRALGKPRASQESPRAWWALVTIGLLPGMAISHPGALVAWMALTVPAVVVFVIRLWRTNRRPALRLAVAGGFVFYLAVGIVFLRVLRPPAEARGWPLSSSIGEAFFTAVTASAWYPTIPVLAAVATLLGLCCALVSRRERTLMAVAMWLVIVVLFVVVAALPFPQIRDALTGSWYNNLPRVAALLGVVVVPLAAYGVGAAWRVVASRRPLRRFARRVPRAARMALGITSAGVGAILLQVTPLSAVPSAVSWAAPIYAMTDTSAPLLSGDELALIERIPDHVSPDEAIAGSPWTGAALAYAYAGAEVLMPHALMEIGPELQTINRGLNEAQPGDSVCRAVVDLNVGFVLDFGTKEVHPGMHNLLPGLQDLDRSPAVRLVDEQGDARLYEIVACG